MTRRLDGCSFLPRLPYKIELHCHEHDVRYRTNNGLRQRLRADWELGVNVMKEGITWIPLGITMLVATVLFGGLFYGGKKRK